ncbi:CBS domain-containing protein [Motiliproteus sp. MSK22-1]|uniref:CBS domain-containing protein n=1 Tax=Motiliproteus sp. MSK22-1 TaxID=1897630 RepID=UPI0009788A5C|nr:CBS domain-containing protein [Motiliproteus sp. MSK22-1]OMH33948.1 CBS domain-containing protein [Motiliproteus sp. MSK22-1]
MSNKKLIQVRDIMKPHFAMVDGLITVQKALEDCRANKVTVLLVQKRHDNDEFGLVLLSDIAKQVLAKDRSPDRVNVYEIMSKPVISVAPDMDVRYCARLFENFGLSVAPVIDNGEVLGIVSYDEIVLEGLL